MAKHPVLALLRRNRCVRRLVSLERRSRAVITPAVFLKEHLSQRRAGFLTTTVGTEFLLARLTVAQAADSCKLPVPYYSALLYLATSSHAGFLYTFARAVKFRKPLPKKRCSGLSLRRSVQLQLPLSDLRLAAWQGSWTPLEDATGLSSNAGDVFWSITTIERSSYAIPRVEKFQLHTHIFLV